MLYLIVLSVNDLILYLLKITLREIGCYTLYSIKCIESYLFSIKLLAITN